ncbi:DedA family protein [Brevundimonas sp.]|uniref:DedA family protein n=1 Tax=Brevundimonas sp. TaxID=1871086 RepID=UPI003D0C3DDF
MDGFVQEISGLITRNAFWAGPMLGLLTLGESLAIVGAFVPATVLMLMAGGLVASGVLPLGPVLAWCFVGAILGEAISYAIGRRTGWSFVRTPILRRHRRSIAKARLCFARYGVIAIFAGRFMGPVQAFVPLVAGITRMAGPRFQIANVGSALIWVPVMLAPGYLATGGLAGLARWPEMSASLIALTALLTGLVVTFEPFLKGRLQNRIGLTGPTPFGSLQRLA